MMTNPWLKIFEDALFRLTVPPKAGGPDAVAAGEGPSAGLRDRPSLRESEELASKTVLQVTQSNVDLDTRNATSKLAIGQRRSVRFVRQSRRGAAFLMLVVLILLVLLGATRALVQSEWSSRRGEAARSRGNTLSRAIDTYVRLPESPTAPVRLPVSDDGTESIEIRVDQNQLTAVWLRGNQTIDELTRPLAVLVERDE